MIVVLTNRRSWLEGLAMDLVNWCNAPLGSCSSTLVSEHASSSLRSCMIAHVYVHMYGGCMDGSIVHGVRIAGALTLWKQACTAWQCAQW